MPANLKAVVKNPCRYEPDLNPTYQDLAEHYGVAVIPTRVRRPRDKAKDDWLRDPLTRSQSQDLLEILDDRYGRTSTMVVTQVPVAEWHSRFPDPTLGDAIRDRLVHNAYRFALVGESRRKADSPLPMPSTWRYNVRASRQVDGMSGTRG